jgi:uroporphyrinogen decarboxylase
MRQAGRYLREYEALKARHTFLELCKSAELATEVSLQPLDILGVDALIVFSDILLPAEALGFTVDFNPGPVVQNAVRHPDELDSLSIRSLREISSPICQTLKNLRAEVTKRSALSASPTEPREAVLGFAGAPWTMSCYLTHQGMYKHFLGTQVFAKQHRKSFHHFLSLLAEMLTEYLLLQVESGAEAVQLFDTWGGNLSREDFREFALPYIQRIFEAVNRTGVPTVLYVNGGSHLLPEMAESGAHCLSLDWRGDLATAREYGLTLQGNFDPTELFSSKEQVIARTNALLKQAALSNGKFQHYIANLGHGVLPKTPRENVIAFVETIKGWCS